MTGMAADVRVGTGWDLHRLEEGRNLVVGGVSIPSPKGSVAHSDGDTLIHSIIDAMLGAAGMDDIGTLFPDTDPSYCGADSAELLSQVFELVAARGFHVCNLDATIVLQSPKLGPYKAAIRQRLASLLGVEPSCVGVKAKTAEGILGELGTGSAIMAQAVVLLGT